MRWRRVLLQLLHVGEASDTASFVPLVSKTLPFIAGCLGGRTAFAAEFFLGVVICIFFLKVKHTVL